MRSSILAAAGERGGAGGIPPGGIPGRGGIPPGTGDGGFGKPGIPDWGGSGGFPKGLGGRGGVPGAWPETGGTRGRDDCPRGGTGPLGTPCGGFLPPKAGGWGGLF